MYLSAEIQALQQDGYQADSQTFVVTGFDGTPTTLNFRIIELWIYNIIGQLITFGFSLGFVTVIFIALLLLSPTDKLRKPTVVLSIASQLLLAFRCITSIIVLCSPSQGIGQATLGANVQYSCSTYTPHIIGGVLAVFLHGCVLVLLILQVRAIFAAERRVRTVLTTVGIIAAIVLQGFMAAWLVGNVFERCHPSYPYGRRLRNWLWLYSGFRIYFISFVGVSCSLFLYKLAVTIYDRRKLCANVTQFGPLQITFIMFTQSLIVPCTTPMLNN